MLSPHTGDDLLDVSGQLGPLPCPALPVAPLPAVQRHVHSFPPGLQYEDDVTAGPQGGGSFNVLRCYVHLYGRDAPLRLVQRIGELEATRDALLAALPPEQQRHVKRRQVDAADEGEGALRWQLPPVVLDEADFRRRFAPGASTPPGT